MYVQNKTLNNIKAKLSTDIINFSLQNNMKK